MFFNNINNKVLLLLLLFFGEVTLDEGTKFLIDLWNYTLADFKECTYTVSSFIYSDIKHFDVIFMLAIKIKKLQLTHFVTIRLLHFMEIDAYYTRRNYKTATKHVNNKKRNGQLLLNDPILYEINRTSHIRCYPNNMRIQYLSCITLVVLENRIRSYIKPLF